MPEKPIVTANPKEERINELAVFTYAKKLSEYIFTVTKQSPKIYRWIVIDRLLNVPLELIELLYLANDSDGDERLSYQKRALSKIKLIGHLAAVGESLQAITPAQSNEMAKQLLQIKRTLWGWRKNSEG